MIKDSPVYFASMFALCFGVVGAFRNDVGWEMPLWMAGALVVSGGIGAALSLGLGPWLLRRIKK